MVSDQTLPCFSLGGEDIAKPGWAFDVGRLSGRVDGGSVSAVIDLTTGIERPTHVNGLKSAGLYDVVLVWYDMIWYPYFDIPSRFT